MPIKIFADGADLAQIAKLACDPCIAGFTTNPTLMRAAGVEDYCAFARDALLAAAGKPVSLEVLSDDPQSVTREANVISTFGDNAVVKVPIVRSTGEPNTDLIAGLVVAGVAVNVTAVFTVRQVLRLCEAVDFVLRGSTARSSIAVSVFAGRVADAGFDPTCAVGECRAVLRAVLPQAELLWASARQVYDVVLAERVGCGIITLSPDLIAKYYALMGKNLEEYSRETSEQFYRDAQAAGYKLNER